MLKCSEEFNEIMKSNIRPALEAEIIVEGVGADGNTVNVKWKSSELQSIKWSRGIDPLGNELPYMELQWTEIVVDAISAELEVQKYQNIVAQMSVTLNWLQGVSLTKTKWKELYQAENTWAQLYNDGRTWANLSAFETIKTPKLFLKSKPTIKDNIVTWTAVDILYFANYNEYKYYNGSANGTSVKNLALLMLVDLRATYWSNQQMRDIIHQSVVNVEHAELLDEQNVIDYDIIMKGAMNANLKNLLASRNLFLDFDDDGALKFASLAKRDIDFEISDLILKKHPTVTLQNAIGEYKCKEYLVEKIPDKKYELSASEEFVESGVEFYRYNFEDIGVASQHSEINYDIEIKTANTEKIQVTPIKNNSYDYNYVDKSLTNADVVSENNTAMPFKIDHKMPLERLKYLRKFQANGLSLLTADFLGHPALSVGDRVTLPTNLVDLYDNKIVKDGFVKSFVFEYNGASKEQIEVNEFRGWS